MQMYNPPHFSQRTCTPSHTHTHVHTHPLCLTLSHLPLMSCYPACLALAPCSLDPVWQPITGQWGGPRSRQPAQHSPAAPSVDDHLGIWLAVGLEEHVGWDMHGSQGKLERGEREVTNVQRHRQVVALTFAQGTLHFKYTLYRTCKCNYLKTFWLSSVFSNTACSSDYVITRWDLTSGISSLSNWKVY